MASKKGITIGTNRLVIICKDYVIKIPMTFRGRLANYVEWVNYINNPDVVATTTRHWYGLKQERLYNLQSFKYKEIKENLPEDIQLLYDRSLINRCRIQVGQDKNGKWKFYDYEDTKYYLRGLYKEN